MAKKKTTVEKYARTSPTIEGLSVETAVATFYDEETGTATVPRSALAELTHYSEKRVRTQVERMEKSGRWAIARDGNKAKTFTPLFVR